ncbi:bifunctional histidinol-phosphatase/imidazoleglycerol-phosphate dehydratase HisB [Legionella waltersii]|uniref:Histidine biosynthesis bifunctional protein HisB n=1 Tax=Legionella waltersii TaxID=66969 RepID=A0A0W1AN39_9GAMM|nr:bifunctional histidinol-phosphatase/imidazoleglycerol-phosphate dehydratase HisB [Legionella waltersii]KTD82688.1 imidazole glycerol-phosphate dehydratase/histidinol phosphatase [Legionella waltersii]SNV03313.1 histidinol-phosphatase [Legionella waltersii]
MKKILFIDRDGTLVEEPFDYQVDSLDKIKLTRGVIPSLLKLQEAGFIFIMVSNQNGIGTRTFPEEDFAICHDFILDLFLSQGIKFADIFICPHMPEDNCECRKPKTGLLNQFLMNTLIDKQSSWVIGDRDTDRELATNIGVPFLPISPKHNWYDVEKAILSQSRQASIHRKTKETDIRISLTLDSDELSLINTPIPFFSHMLEQVAKHGGFSLQLNAQGDLQVDDHHLVEDIAICLGEALKKALGDKWGINRYGFTLPMDDALASIAIDVCGRSFCHFEAPFSREFVGNLATEMIPHFFSSFANSLAATIHVKVTGTNHHHMIEGCFKALGRSLRQACAKTSTGIPSTKGAL